MDNEDSISFGISHIFIVVAEANNLTDSLNSLYTATVSIKEMQISQQKFGIIRKDLQKSSKKIKRGLKDFSSNNHDNSMIL
jgi:hypothetical protein